LPQGLHDQRDSNCDRDNGADIQENFHDPSSIS
jgi:hypothetical protein